MLFKWLVQLTDVSLLSPFCHSHELAS
uniref:Uncharacterized protein n=1 Tax=Anguilla anguilla TaxID=7936 RepID=A0A0E9QDF2_ANGAN